jgi:uncharacterized membrane protein (UPF0127 family)
MGLMFRRRLPEGSGLLLMPCGSIHMCFMRMKLDIVYLDGGFRVLGLERDLKPWRLGKSVPGTRLVLELPAGTIDRCGIASGETLTVEAPKPDAAIEMGSIHGYEGSANCCES